MKNSGAGLYDPLFFIGVVENNVDERLEKRVQVRAFGVHGNVDQVPTENLPWATLIMGNYDPNSPVPHINQFVFGFFVDGRDAQQPMILGLIPTRMTELVDPSITGWGAIPSKNARLLAKGSNPEDFGQPSNSKLERGEYTDQTYVLLQEMKRVINIPVAKASDGDQTAGFSEPSPAYNAEYPFNRVIETANHSIELDDTPGAERITVYHKSGSYVSIDARGTSVHKSSSDKYEINDTHQHVYVGGKSYVTIVGDSRVLVKGNKIEEIEGDYIQTVRGNHMLSVAGQMNFNGSEEVQIRAAKLRFQSNVENINFKSSKNIRIESDESIHIKSNQNMFTEVFDTYHIKSDNVRIGSDTRADISSQGTLFIESDAAMNIKSGSNMFVQAAGTSHLRSDILRIGGGSRVDINSTQVNIDDNISMANGDAIAPTSASASVNPVEAVSAETPVMPPPASKSVSTTRHVNNSSKGCCGFGSNDDISPNATTREPGADKNTVVNTPANASMDAVDLIKSFEGFSSKPYEDFGQWSIGYGTGVGPSSQPPRINQISEAEASQLLSQEISKYASNVEKINRIGGYNWSQESKDALTSFAYNIGSIDQLTANGTRDNATIASKMLEYVNAGGVPQRGLITRRSIERDKFLSGLSGYIGS